MAVHEPRHDRIVLRVVYDGPGHVGKTTNVEQLALAYHGEHRPDPPDSRLAGGRTRYFDWFCFDGGKLDGHALQIQIVSVPGPKRFEARRAHLLRSADVIVLVCDSTAAAQESGRETLVSQREHLGALATDIPLVVQANKQDITGALLPHEVGIAMMLPFEVPVLGAQASAGIGVRETMVQAVRAAVRRIKRHITRNGIGSLAGRAATADSLRAELDRLTSIGVPEDGPPLPPKTRKRGASRPTMVREPKVVHVRAGMIAHSHGELSELASKDDDPADRPPAAEPEPPPRPGKRSKPQRKTLADAPLDPAARQSFDLSPEPDDPPLPDLAPLQRRELTPAPDDPPLPDLSAGTAAPNLPGKPTLPSSTPTLPPPDRSHGAGAPRWPAPPELPRGPGTVPRIPAPPDLSRGPGAPPHIPAPPNLSSGPATLTGMPARPGLSHAPTSLAGVSARHDLSPGTGPEPPAPARPNLSPETAPAPHATTSPNLSPGTGPEPHLPARPDPSHQPGALPDVPELPDLSQPPETLRIVRTDMSSGSGRPPPAAAAPGPQRPTVASHAPGEMSAAALHALVELATAHHPGHPEPRREQAHGHAHELLPRPPDEPGEPIPPLPRADVPQGHVWPIPRGREILRELTSLTPERLPAPPRAAHDPPLLLAAGAWRLCTRPSQRFGALAAAHAALVERVRQTRPCAALLASEVVLVVQPDGDEGGRLWHVAPRLDGIREHLALRPPQTRPRLLAALAAAVVGVLRLWLRHGVALELNLSAFAVEAGRVVHLGDRIGAHQTELGTALLGFCERLSGDAAALAAFTAALEQELADLDPDERTRLDLEAALGRAETRYQDAHIARSRLLAALRGET